MRTVQRGITTTFVIIIILASVVAVTIVYFNLYLTQNKKLSAINSFEDCAKHYPVMESYPEQCSTPDGKHFTQELSDEEKQKLVPLAQQSPIAEKANIKTLNEEYSNIRFNYPSDWAVSMGDFTIILPQFRQDQINSIPSKVEKEDYPRQKYSPIIITLDSKKPTPSADIQVDSKKVSLETKEVTEYVVKDLSQPNVPARSEIFIKLKNLEYKITLSNPEYKDVFYLIANTLDSK